MTVTVRCALCDATLQPSEDCARCTPGWRMSIAEQLAALQRCIDALTHGPTRRPVHPETGCMCQRCVARDDALESRAEDRAAERRGDGWSERDLGELADWRAGR